ncbi:MAG TPA: L,D-transpeptidase family protein [Solirubrobacteraceae bacterium]|nr:L,D-transpeptidase family protein [Solirubrobacteraceae bacterium]
MRRRSAGSRVGAARGALAVALAAAALLCSLVLPAGAGAEGLAPGASAPGEASTPAGAPVSGRVLVTLAGVGGKPLFALERRRIVVSGAVTPYVAGQTVAVSLFVDGRSVASRAVSVLPGAGGAGRFRLVLVSRHGGLAQVRAVHAASPQQAAFQARSPRFRVVEADLGPGAHGQSVRLLQSELNALHYAVPLTGSFDEGTGQALIAYRKMTGLERVPYAGERVFELLARRAGRFRVRHRADGRHVEADLTRQVLAEIEPGGRVRRIYTISSGKPSTPTVLGRFQVYLKTPGVNSEGMVDSNYFIRGYAIHGYAEVPTYAASHGCLRVPIPDAPAIYSWVRLGTPVDVYYE